MEEHVSGIRDRFYHDLIRDYNDKGERCLLYKFTWTENAVELLKKLKKKYQAYFPDIATEAPRGPKDLQARLEKAMKICTREQIQKVLEQELQTERQDLWQQLWIRDAYYRMEQRSHGYGKPKDFGNDNFLWLVRYLAERDKYYRESCPAMTDETALLEQLYRMAREGLRDTENAPGYELRTGTGRFRKDKLKNSLIKLAEQLENEGGPGRPSAGCAGWALWIGCGSCWNARRSI